MSLIYALPLFVFFAVLVTSTLCYQAGVLMWRKNLRGGMRMLLAAMIVAYMSAVMLTPQFA